MPGTDHASIATEVKIVEADAQGGGPVRRRISAATGFLERAWAWKEQYGGRIVQQLKKLGSLLRLGRASASRWTRAAPRRCSEVFVKLYEKGLIYQRRAASSTGAPSARRRFRTRRWNTRSRPAHFWHIRYAARATAAAAWYVATTRPETHAGRHRRRRATRRTSGTRPSCGQDGHPAADEPRDPGGRATNMSTWNSGPAWSRSPRRTTRTTLRSALRHQPAGHPRAERRRQHQRRRAANTAGMDPLRSAQGHRRGPGSGAAIWCSIEDYSHNVGTCYRCHARRGAA